MNPENFEKVKHLYDLRVQLIQVESFFEKGKSGEPWFPERVVKQWGDEFAETARKARLVIEEEIIAL